ncbi:Putative ATP:guanido phosphotransferase [Candidatus Rubidus massiliensis]|nr:Putative ATP:guanido phosphotransferase [Candidatus Rubidus massiliensis]
MANSSPFLETQSKLWKTNQNNIWLASTISLFRNIDKFNFPSKLDLEKRKQIVSFLSKSLLSEKFLVNPILLKAEELSPLEKGFLSEHYLSKNNFNQAHTGEGFVLDETGQFLASINLEDHLQLRWIELEGNIEFAWNKLVKLETQIGKKFGFAFSPRFGFLTSDFQQCGTGLKISIYLQLPALIHTGKIEDILDKNDDEAIWITGIHGDPTEIIGDILVIQNNYVLGVTEENIIASLQSYATKLIMEENSARKELKETQNTTIKDMVSRAYGILVHSYNIEAVESLNALSLIKLGLEMNWIQGISSEQLNQLFFDCQRSHLILNDSNKVVQEDIIHKRAEYIHQQLKEAKLVV